MHRDHYVGFRSEETIAKLAIRLRANIELGFNIVEFVEEILPKLLKSGQLKLDIYDREFPEDDPAYVTYNPLTLHVDTKIWIDARNGEGYARFVIAHEIGHIVLHDNSAKAFSTEKSDQIKFSDDGQSAEWQANTFARHFLVPDSAALKLEDISVIMIVCKVTEDLALDRVLSVRRELDRKGRVFEGDFCSGCGNFSLKRVGTLLRCTVCTNVTSCL